MTTAQHKRKALRDLISGSETFTIVGAFDAICAKFVQKHGFPCTYVSGSATAASLLGLPDLGMTTLTEVATEAGAVAGAVDIPCIADADTGFGELTNIPRCVNVFEEKGIAGIHIEDQVFPKRCGHLDGKEIIPEHEMVAKIRAAASARQDPNFIIIARCDAYSVSGFDDMAHRIQAYSDAGADMIFPEALKTLAEFEKISTASPKPILANMTEFGKTPYYTVSNFTNAGVRAVLFPLTIYRTCMKTMDRAITTLKQTGTQETFLADIYPRKDFYDLIDYAKYESQAIAALKRSQ